MKELIDNVLAGVLVLFVTTALAGALFSGSAVIIAATVAMVGLLGFQCIFWWCVITKYKTSKAARDAAKKWRDK